MAAQHRHSGADPSHHGSTQVALLVLGAACLILLVLLALASLAGWL